MKKLTLAVLIVGTFVIYSFVYRQSNDPALMPTTVADSGTVARSITPTAAGSASMPPTPTPAVVATAPTVTPTTSLATTTSVAQVPTPPLLPTSTPTPTPNPSGNYRDGSYVGQVADAQWGLLQVKAVVSNGQIADVQFLQYPSDRSRSVRINSVADPILRTEAIQAQSAQVDIVSGATDSSEAFIQSLSTALSQAQG